MIRIENERQKFGLTCSELSELAAPKYRFCFVNEMTNEAKTIFLNDLSTFRRRFNCFEIEKAFFPAPGWYSFKVFEQASEDPEDPFAREVEAGRALVIADNVNTFTENNSTAIFSEYDQ